MNVDVLRSKPQNPKLSETVSPTEKLQAVKILCNSIVTNNKPNLSVRKQDKRVTRRPPVGVFHEQNSFVIVSHWYILTEKVNLKTVH